MIRKLNFCFLLLTLLCSDSFAQGRKITGIVSDEKGQTLPGASVTLKDKKGTVLTDKDGKFIFELPEGNQVLVFSFVGMESQEIPVGNKTFITVTMRPLATVLADAVVIGYGTVKKGDLTGAVQRVTREDLVRDAPTNVLQAMQGKLAGVAVTQNDGAPGAGISLRIRGSNSFLGGTEPLYVIDGIPFNNNSSGSTPQSIGSDEKQTLNILSFVNPNDIESIEVLKDASATAIYGSRGANGVVLITTRKGKSGKDKVEFNANVGVAEVSKKLKMLSTYDYMIYQNLAYANANKYDGSTLNPLFSNPEEFRDDSKNWQDEIFRRGLYQNYSVNVSGGNDAGSHSLTFNYLNQEGTILNSNFTKFGLNLNLHRNLGRIFKIGTSTSISNTVTNGVKTGTDKSDAASAGVIRSALTYPTSIMTNDEYQESGQGFFITNPVIYAKDVLNRVKGLSIFSANYMEAAITKTLKFRQNIGFNYGSNARDQYYPRTVYEGFSIKGRGLKANNLWTSMVSESILTFNKKFNKHSLNVMGAGTYERTNGQWNRAEAQTFPNDLLQNENMKLGAVQSPVVDYRYQSTLISFLGRINYAYDDKYLLTVSFREDGSSKFGKDNKWAGFASAAFAWKLMNEKFMADQKLFSDLKFRMSYGQTGNQGIGAYASLAKLVVYNYPFNGTLQSGLADDLNSGAANDKLKWETTSAYNIGFDASFISNRIGLHVDLYKKKTSDLLQFITTPPSTGFLRQLRNSGDVENKGVEFVIDGGIVRKKDFEWNTSFNLSFNKNKILSLGGDLLEQYASNISTGDAPFIQTAGQPIGAIIGYVEDGYYDNEAEVRNDPAYTDANPAIIKRMVGEIKFKNLDKDPASISESDRVIIGNVNPDYMFGFTNNFRYKKWDLSVFVNGVQGNDIINMNTRFNANLGAFKNISYDMNDGAWAEGKDNTNASGPKVMRQFWRTMYFSRRFIEDGSFVRIKNITLAYNIPTVRIKAITALRVSVGVNNLYTFTKYSGFDPEINSYGDDPALFGVDLGGYPNSRTYNFTVRCNF